MTKGQQQPEDSRNRGPGIRYCGLVVDSALCWKTALWRRGSHGLLNAARKALCVEDAPNMVLGRSGLGWRCGCLQNAPRSRTVLSLSKRGSLQKSWPVRLFAWLRPKSWWGQGPAKANHSPPYSQLSDMIGLPARLRGERCVGLAQRQNFDPKPSTLSIPSLTFLPRSSRAGPRSQPALRVPSGPSSLLEKPAYQMNVAPLARRPLGCLKASLRQARQQKLLVRSMATEASTSSQQTENVASPPVLVQPGFREPPPGPSPHDLAPPPSSSLFTL